MKRNLFSFPRSQMVGKMLRAMSFVVAVFWATTAMADIVVKGVVADDSGLPIPGANVTELNSKGNGTITNVDGQYSIVVKGPKSVLRFSFIGYTKEDVTVGNKTQIDVQLSEDSKSLDEVVVIGYGTMRKKDLSGAVASIKSEDLMIGNPTSFSQALQGKLAGVQVNSNDGAPGSGMSITIRGANSFSTSSQPLYIVDGIPFDAGSAPTSGANENNNTTSNPLSLINPNDIESIDVLKDASATAIYGSRGANGVVLITTKKGKSGAAKVEFSANFGLSKISKIVESLNAYEYANFVNEATINNALYDNTPYAYLPYRGDWNYRRDPQNNIIPESGTYEPAPEDFLNPGWHEDEYGNREWVEGTNWLDEILQDAFTQEYNISVSGGNDKSHYAFSGNYTDQTGIIRNSGYDRLAVRANVGSQVKSWLNTGLNINFTKSNTRFAKSNSYDYSIIRSAMLYPPTIYVGDHTQDDEYFWLSANPRTYVNMACADFGSNFPGVYNTDYTYPQASDLDYWNEKGLKLVRFPFKWERLQYELNGELNRHDLDKMKDFVAAAAERGMVVMLDLHNYCRRYMNGEHTIIGTNGLTPEHLASFWKSLATEFKSFDNIYAYGLMNEPHDLDSCTTWFEMAQLCIDSIRTVDMDTRIMVGGDSWCSAERWLEYSDTLKYLKDPADKLAFEAHVYFDADASGTYKRGYDEDSCYLEKGIDRVRPFVEWLKANKFEGMVGEYGIPDSDSRWNLVLDKFLSYLQENDINGCYWAAGPWWPKDEFMAITPVDGKDRPQMEVVGKYLTTQK